MTMKKYASILLALVLAVGLCSCAPQQSAPAPAESGSAPAAQSPAPSQGEASPAPADDPTADMGPIMKKAYETGVVNVCYFAQKPPFQYHKMVDGKDTVIGFEVSMSDFIAERLSEEFGREVKFVPSVMTVQGGLAAIQAGQVDCMPGLAGTAERRENMDFTIPYHRSLQTIVVLKDRFDDPKYRIDNQMSGVVVSVEKGSSTAITLKEQYPEVVLLELEKSSDVLISMVTGKSDAAIFAEKPALLYCKANENIMIVDELSFDVPKERDPGASYAVPKGNEDFVAFCDQYIEQIMNDGTFARFEQEAIAQLDDPEVLQNYDAKNYL